MRRSLCVRRSPECIISRDLGRKTPTDSELQWFEAKAHDFTRGMKPAAGVTLDIEAQMVNDSESEVRIRTLYVGK